MGGFFVGINNIFPFNKIILLIVMNMHRQCFLYNGVFVNLFFMFYFRAEHPYQLN